MGNRQLGARRAGFTLIEVMVAVVLLSVAMVGFARSVVSGISAGGTHREIRTASEASRGVLERVSGSDFSQVVALYNANPDDDPGVAGTAPGANFDVTGLEAQDGDADGQVGEILLPVRQVGGVWQVREDMELPELGMPRDLSGDGVIDDQDHSLDYVLMPVRVQIEWQGNGAPAKVEFHTVLMGI